MRGVVMNIRDWRVFDNAEKAGTEIEYWGRKHSISRDCYLVRGDWRRVRRIYRVTMEDGSVVFGKEAGASERGCLYSVYDFGVWFSVGKSDKVEDVTIEWYREHPERVNDVHFLA